jgi:hypothetical protein
MIRRNSSGGTLAAQPHVLAREVRRGLGSGDGASDMRAA